LIGLGSVIFTSSFSVTSDGVGAVLVSVGWGMVCACGIMHPLLESWSCTSSLFFGRVVVISLWKVHKLLSY
jgi:hypothetical protein